MPESIGFQLFWGEGAVVMLKFTEGKSKVSEFASNAHKSDVN